MPRYVDPGTSIFYYFVAIILPPMAVGMIEGWSKQVLINLGCWIVGGIPGIIHACYIISRRTLHHPSAYEDLEACPHGDPRYPHAHGYEWVRVPVCYVAPHRPAINCTFTQSHEMDHAPLPSRPVCVTRNLPGAGTASTQPRARTDENQTHSIKGFVPHSPSESDAPLLQDEDLYDPPTLNYQAPAYEAPTPLGRDEMRKLKEDMQDKKSF